MLFIDGFGGRKMLPKFKGKSTIDLILEGYRTATSRDQTIVEKDVDGRITSLVQRLLLLTTLYKMGWK